MTQLKFINLSIKINRTVEVNLSILHTVHQFLKHFTLQLLKNLHFLLQLLAHLFRAQIYLLYLHSVLQVNQILQIST